MRKLEVLEKNEFNMICDSLNGVVLNFKPINWRISITDDLIDSGNRLKSKWNADIEDLECKLDNLSNLEFLELLDDVDLFWQNDERHYALLNSISPKSKILEITSETEKHEPIIWNSQAGSLHDFYMVALGLNLEYIIYVQDSEGNDKSIWATSEINLLECLFDISEKYYFGRLQRIQTAIKKSF